MGPEKKYSAWTTIYLAPCGEDDLTARYLPSKAGVLSRDYGCARIGATGMRDAKVCRESNHRIYSHGSAAIREGGTKGAERGPKAQAKSMGQPRSEW
jgi:hypothetical protein